MAFGVLFFWVNKKMLICLHRKRQINRPRPVSVQDMEEIFQQAKEEQEKSDQAFKEEQLGEEVINSGNIVDNGIIKSVKDSIQTRGSAKISDPLTNGSPRKKTSKLPTKGSTVRVISGTFAEYEGSLRKISRKTGKVELYHINNVICSLK